tara:strand:- start:69 stop:206 length:138 start_codon:yes stop_codon:yes gene_type:complete
MKKFYRIHGYDRILMEYYIKPEKYETFEESFAKCKMVDEYVAKEE